MAKIDMSKNYEKIADWFDLHRNKSLMEKDYLDIVLKIIPKNGCVLDLGCGSGEPIAKYLIEHGCKVTGVDGSQRMIEFCQSRFPDMRWIVADMRELDITDKFDSILAWHSFFHLDLESQRRMFTFFESHLNQHGLLIFTSGLNEGEDWSEGGHPDFNGGEALYLASLSTYEYEILLKKHGFEVLIHRCQDPQCGGATVWVAKYVANNT